MPHEVRWFQEVARTESSVRPVERNRAVLEGLRANPGPWREHSRHVSRNAARVAAHRWRRRWAGEEDRMQFHAKIRNLYPDSDTPWALLLAYSPTVLREQ